MVEDAGTTKSVTEIVTATGNSSFDSTTATADTDAVTTTVIGNPAVSVVKTGVVGDPVAVDDVVTYSFLVTNSGNRDSHRCHGC